MEVGVAKLSEDLELVKILEDLTVEQVRARSATATTPSVKFVIVVLHSTAINKVFFKVKNRIVEILKYSIQSCFVKTLPILVTTSHLEAFLINNSSPSAFQLKPRINRLPNTRQYR